MSIKTMIILGALSFFSMLATVRGAPEIFSFLVLINIIILCAILCAIPRLLKRSNLKKRQAQLIQEASTFFNEVKNNGGFFPISTYILLKNNEQAILYDHCRLIESRSTRHFERTGGSVRIGRCSIGQSAGTSYGVDNLKAVDDGCLILTNKRLIFDGRKFDRSIPLNKILSVNSYTNYIEISSESREKSMLFTVGNSLIWETSLKTVTQVEDPFHFQGINFAYQG